MNEISNASSPQLPFSRTLSPLDPPPEYTRWRTEQPVTRVAIWGGRLRPWLITRYKDARTVLGSHSFSTDARNPGFPGFQEDAQPLPRGFFQQVDPPDHTVLRRVLSGEFRVKEINRLRPAIKCLTGRLLDEMTSRPAPADLVRCFSIRLPSQVICTLLGVPPEDQEFFERHSDRIAGIASSRDEIQNSINELGQYITDVVQDKEKIAGKGLIGRLAERVSPGLLSVEDASNLVSFLLVAGHDTTAKMISLSTIALLENPDQIPILLSGDDAAARAVEELLRYLTIVHGGLRRYALEDVEVGGVTIRSGEGVIVSLSAANRDPGTFSNPDRLDLSRLAHNHLAFGWGIHSCLGHSLARAQLQIALPALFRRLPRLRLALPLKEMEFTESSIVHGVRELPVAW